MDGYDSPTAVPSEDVVYWKGDLSAMQQDVLYILDGTLGAISVFGSTFLFYLIWANSAKSHALSPRHRILYGLSFFDFLGSFRNCVTGYRDIHHQRTEPGSMCTVNGFITYISYSAPFYNLFLSVYYYFTIRGGVRQKTFELKYEKWCHAVAILYPFILGTIGLPFKVYNPAGGNRPGCLATPYPYGCTVLPDVECTRGQHATIFLTAILGTIFFVILPLIILTNILIYLHVRKLDHRSRRFSLADDRAAKTQRVATQCFLYVFVFFLTWIWTLINIIIEWYDTANFEAGKYYGMLILGHFFYPLQGFGNLVVYLRPIYIQLRKSGLTRWMALAHLLSNKPLPVAEHHHHHHDEENLGGISTASIKNPGSLMSGHFHFVSRLFLSQQFNISDKKEACRKDQQQKAEDEEEGTQEPLPQGDDDKANDPVTTEKGSEVNASINTGTPRT